MIETLDDIEKYVKNNRTTELGSVWDYMLADIYAGTEYYTIEDFLEEAEYLLMTGKLSRREHDGLYGQ